MEDRAAIKTTEQQFLCNYQINIYIHIKMYKHTTLVIKTFRMMKKNLTTNASGYITVVIRTRISMNLHLLFQTHV